MFSDSATAACTWEYDMPPSIAANSSPQRNNHDAALASRANASGSAIGPRLKTRSWGSSKLSMGGTVSGLRVTDDGAVALA